jgi:hypothetical protein
MRILLVILALASGCRSRFDDTRPLEYPCARDAGMDVCPAGFRCGLSLRCHAIDAAAAYACETNDDCERGWRCGLEKVCHDPGVAAAYVCGSDADCEGGWHCPCCGEAKVCHAPGVAAAYPCRTNADCEGGWHCGLEGVCHDPDAGAPYVCTADSQCEVGWRCGLEGRCVDSRAEALSTSAYEGPVTRERLNPMLFETVPEQVAGTPFQDWTNDVAQTFALVRGGELVHVFHRSAPADAGQRFSIIDAVWLDAGAVLAIAETYDRTYVADQAGLLEVAWSIDGGLSTRRLSPPAPARALRALAAYRGVVGPRRAMVVGVGDDRLWVYDVLGDSFVLSPLLLRDDGGSQTLVDATVALSSEWPAPARFVVTAATHDGLFSLAFVDGGFRQADGGEAVTSDDWQPNVYETARLHTDAGDGLVVRADLYLDSFASPFFIIEPGGDDAGALAVMSDGDQDICLACPDGGTLVDVTRGASWFISWCRDPGTHHLRGFNEDFMTPGCEEWAGSYAGPFGADERTVGNSTIGASVHASVHGQLWQPQGWSFGFSRFTLDTVGALYRRHGQVQALASSNAYVLEPGAGLVFAGMNAAIAGAPVEGDLSHVVSTDQQAPGLYDLSGPLPRRLTLDAPDDARRATLPDGGTLWVGVRYDKLLSARNEGDAGLFEERLSPLPFLPITSFTLLSPHAQSDGGVPLVSGYALTAGGLFYFSASSEQQWRAQRISLPEADYSAVWADGPFGRVATPDGRVLSLPSRLTLSQPLPGQVVQYAQLCRQSWALADTGLYRLTSTGAWVAQQVSDLLPGAVFDTGLDGGRLFADGSALHLVTAFGTVVQLEAPLSCE